MPVQKGKCNVALTMEYRKAEKHKKPLDHSDEQNITGKTVVITGANSGVGEAAALEFAKRGAIVVMACRDMAKAEKVVQDIKAKVPGVELDLLKIDLGDLNSVRQCAKEITAKYKKIDILVNNAGFANWKKELDTTKEGFEVHMAVNHLGPHLFTHLLLEPLKNAAPSRIIFVSSMAFQMGQLDPEDFMLEKGGNFLTQNFGAYSNSKLATNYCAKIMAKELEKSDVHVYCLCPGFVKSGFQKDNFLIKIFTNIMSINPPEGAENILYCALMNSTANQSGLMYRTNGVWEGAMEALDDDVGKQVHHKTMQCIGLT